MNKLVVFLLLFTLAFSGFAQVQKAKLPKIINVPTKSQIYPSLTADEKYMLFYTNYTNTRNYELKYTKKTGPNSWSEPEYIEHILKPHNDHFASFNVSPNGKYMLFSSYRAGGIGKYDILISERDGDQWSQPKNPGKPLNSPANEGNPSMSPDGRSIYFMRCDEMDASKKSGCKIFVSHKRSKNIWGEPTELPSYINTGHSTSPRILSDNQTLIYSSEKPGNKGKLDLYMTKFENGIWSQPVPLDIINTVKNDEFVSVPARGDVIYYTDVAKDQFIIAMALLPEELRPKKVILVSGNIRNAQATEKINIQSYDAHTGELVTSINLEEGESEFDFILPEGRVYDFSIFPVDGQHTYYSQIYDFNNLESSNIEYLDFTVDPLRPGTSYYLPTLQFDTVTHQIKDISQVEFRRIMAILQKNPGLNVEFNVFTSKPLKKEFVEVFTYATDSIGGYFGDSTSYMAMNYSQESENDTDMGNFEEKTTQVDYNDMDNSEFINWEEELSETEAEMDSTDYVDTSQVDLERSYYQQMNYEEKIVFDPEETTREYAELIKTYLIQNGTPSYLISVNGKGNDYLIDRTTGDNEFWVEMKLSY